MTDEELITRLLDWEEYDEGDINDAREAAAKRIKELKAQLENLLGGAETVLEAWDRGDEASFREAIEEMRADVAEAKGGKDE